MASLYSQRRLKDLEKLLDEQYENLAFPELERDRIADMAQEFYLNKKRENSKSKAASSRRTPKCFYG
ncbi:MAG TPA: hypothetical protein PLB18_17635 [Acidobacteriota bacterium]|nr:hypothetical protein [Acidobacteriota bacterium]HND21197.1 hypothetical protein [Acidobacteriota bacterium]HNH84287.1 hypothetical protein [Acidobacteriota bacterium]